MELKTTQREGGSKRASRTLAFATNLAVAMLLLGCAETRPSSVGAEATIANQAKKTITRLAYEKCGASADGWLPLAAPAIRPNQSIKVNLPPGCIDLNAYYDDGKLAGSQRGITTNYPFSWQLQ